MNYEKNKRLLFLVLPCILAYTFSVIYSLGIWPLFQIATVNILCISLISLNFIQAFTEKTNIWKACSFIGASSIGGTVASLNILNDTESKIFVLNQLSFWSWLWIFLLSLAVIALMIMLVRISLWNQDKWEEIQKQQQESRKEQIILRQNQRKLKQEYKQKLSKEKADAKLLKQKEQENNNIELRKKRHEQRLNFFNEWENNWNIIINSVKKHLKNIFSGFLVFIMAFMFLFIPYNEELQTAAKTWIDSVNKLSEKIDFSPDTVQNNDDKESSQKESTFNSEQSYINEQPSQTENSSDFEQNNADEKLAKKNTSLNSEKSNFLRAFANYALFYIFLIFAVWIIFFLCKCIYRILAKERKSQENDIENVFEEYDTPIAILTVFTALMFWLGNGAFSMENISGGWGALFIVILFILVIILSVEIVRLVLKQIGQKNSLLKKAIQLIFIATLEFFTGLVLGVTINFKIEKVISSLLSMVFPKDKLYFTNKIQEKFDELFNKEINQDNDNSHKSPDFSKKNIWRRCNKK